MEKHNLFEGVNISKLVKQRKKNEKLFVKKLNKKFNLNIRLIKLKRKDNYENNIR